jgi:hypothetical protein
MSMFLSDNPRYPQFVGPMNDLIKKLMTDKTLDPLVKQDITAKIDSLQNQFIDRLKPNQNTPYVKSRGGWASDVPVDQRYVPFGTKLPNGTYGSDVFASTLKDLTSQYDSVSTGGDYTFQDNSLASVYGARKKVAQNTSIASHTLLTGRQQGGSLLT